MTRPFLDLFTNTHSLDVPMMHLHPSEQAEEAAEVEHCHDSHPTHWTGAGAGTGNSMFPVVISTYQLTFPRSILYHTHLPTTCPLTATTA